MLRFGATISGRRRAARVLALAASALGFVACEYPTSLPKLHPTYLLPGETTVLGVSELLPSNVTAGPASFGLTLSPAAIPSRTLASMCGMPCIAAHGRQVPKPAFDDSVSTVVALPAEVLTATVTSGTMTVALTHNFGFDPLQPPGAAAAGWLTVRVLSGQRVVASSTITGAFPSGTTMERTVSLQPGPVSSDFRIIVGITSPAGGTAPEHWVTVNANATLGGTVTPGQIDVAEATVRVQDRQVSVIDATLDLSGVDDDLRDRVVDGALVVALDNPFTVTGTLQIQLTGGAAPVTKTLAVQPGASTRRVAFTEEELQLLLGHVVQLRISGTVTGENGQVTVRPDQQLGLDTKLELTVEIG
ncbi:MAG TPA: hypothetical protein VK929_17110 [Longimicrobiales bacterium]|nr:hypothetical protein [Longimicrobiales bacterium]